jgi:low affinity Fe/Cu permease
MVFLIQHTTGVQTRAVLLKLDELIRATDGARNDVIAAEQRPLHEQERLEQRVTADA